MMDGRFFGYGSLVNRATHDNTVVARSSLKGWRRVWRSTSLREMAYLSVMPDPDPVSEIEGLVAEVPGGDWAALDERETGYDKEPIITPAGGAAVYVVPERNLVPENWGVLLSYLDTVAQGYLQEFGEPGLARFFHTTYGWTRVHDDRDAPLYPRATVLSPAETTLVDDWVVWAMDREA